MAYGESNSHVIDDVTWPWNVKLVSQSAISWKQPETLFNW